MSILLPKLISALVKHGPMHAHALHAITGIEVAYASNEMLRWVRRKKYGLYVAGKTRVGKVNCNIWAVNTADLDDYMRWRMEQLRLAQSLCMQAQSKNRSMKKQNVSKSAGRVMSLVPKTPFRTRWQPSSPYYTEAST